MATYLIVMTLLSVVAALAACYIASRVEQRVREICARAEKLQRESQK